MSAACRECARYPHSGNVRLALPNVELCEEHLREQQRIDHAALAVNTLDDVRPFSLAHESARIQRIENALHGLDMATALRALEYVRSRVIGSGGFK